MSEDAQKSIDLILNGTKSPQGVAIKMLARMVDGYETNAAERHKELLSAIKKNKDETDQALKGIEVVRFFSSHPKWLGLIISGVLVLIGAGADNIWSKLFK